MSTAMLHDNKKRGRIKRKVAKRFSSDFASVSLCFKRIVLILVLRVLVATALRAVALVSRQ